MKIATSLLLAALLLVGILGLSGAAPGADSALLKEEFAPGYGHLKFPAIREETLKWDRPVLKDPSTGDVIDFYGPTDQDPLGKDQILSQKRQDNFTDKD